MHKHLEKHDIAPKDARLFIVLCAFVLNIYVLIHLYTQLFLEKKKL